MFLIIFQQLYNHHLVVPQYRQVAFILSYLGVYFIAIHDTAPGQFLGTAQPCITPAPRFKS